ncbi:MAG: Copper amine oxidase [Sarcosagium campestre]|nr:MAG: Copper amine oxidase [Sarcosagium campestre]
MVLERWKKVNGQMNGTSLLPHPLDPLSEAEIESAVAVIRAEHDSLSYNAISLWEPRKESMLKWLEKPEEAPRPHRVADVVALGTGGKVYDGLVDLNERSIIKWELIDSVQPIISMEELQTVERVARTDPKIIEQCNIIGIPREDMHKVYCDPWTIGFDERFGSKVRLQQALMYYRPHVDDNQYTYPLDFCPIYNSETREIVHIDIPSVRRPLSKAAPSNYHRAAIEAEGGYRNDVKPINITQPEGVSFRVDGRIVDWQNWKVHVGFNYREGIVLSNITYTDKGTERPVFYRISLAEMVVPYGNPEHPHPRKHAFDLGEYGGGYMTNSLALGCDCKGAIHYMDAAFVDRAGQSYTIKNAICIHEEDDGILFKHSDFRDNSATVTRGRKLIISHIFTAANYEYCVYWIFRQDGSIQLEVKLTGILNTYAMAPDEDTHGWGTQVYPGVNAHNHQHIFCLRLDPNIDGPSNTVYQVDAIPGAPPVGSPENQHGNAFFPQRTRYSRVREAIADYDAASSRTWDMVNESKRNAYSGLPVAYKLVSREVPTLLPKPGGLVWNRAGFARHAVHVTRYNDEQIHPAGRHVPQTSGKPSRGLPEWIAADEDANIADTDVVLWHTFGITHFPAPEDFPVMPAEPVSVLLRPRNFFLRNPALDVPPSFSTVPSQVGEQGSKVEASLFDDGREIALLHSIYSHPSLPDIRGSPSAVLAAIDDYAKTKFLMNVGSEKGKIVVDLISEVKPQVMVELGGYVGYSAIKFGDAVRKAGGKRYYSLERNPEFAAVVASLVDLAGLSDIVKVVVGSSAESIRRLHADGSLKHIDLLFLDHFKPAYKTDLKLCEQLGLISPGSVLAADNVIKPGNPPYLGYVRSSVSEKRERLAKGDEDENIASVFPAAVLEYYERHGISVRDLGKAVQGNPNLVYESKLIESYEPTGTPDGVEITRCTGEEK